jgi:nucleoredoxin
MTMKILLLLFMALGLAGLDAADLTTRDGQVYRKYTVLGHDAGYITIMYADGGGKIPLSQLPADLQAKYGYDSAKSSQFVQQDQAADRQARAQLAQAQFAAAQQQADTATRQQGQTTVPSGPLTGFASKFDSHLIVMRNGKPQDLNVHTLTGVKYWAFYYSASWCPPCRAFTPSLVSFYRDFKPSHPDFELVFVNADHTEDAMLNYMQDDNMAWPAIRYDDIHPGALGVGKYCGNGIPCLVLVDAGGKVLSDTNRNGEYVGPEMVMDDIKTMVK